MIITIVIAIITIIIIISTIIIITNTIIITIIVIIIPATFGTVKRTVLLATLCCDIFQATLCVRDQT